MGVAGASSRQQQKAPSSFLLLFQCCRVHKFQGTERKKVVACSEILIIIAFHGENVYLGLEIMGPAYRTFAGMMLCLVFAVALMILAGELI